MLIQWIAIFSDSVLRLGFLRVTQDALVTLLNTQPFQLRPVTSYCPPWLAEQEDSGLHVSIQHASPFPLLQLQSQMLNTTAQITSVNSSLNDISGERLNNLKSFSLLGIVWSKLLSFFFPKV